LTAKEVNPDFSTKKKCPGKVEVKVKVKVKVEIEVEVWV
jgi:hypothetical protein